MTDREQAIKDLGDIIATAEGIKGLPSQYGGITISLDKIDSLKFALESIKVDRAYDLAYEKVDFIEIPEKATNGDMIKAMFPKAWRSNYIDSTNKFTLYIDDDHELEVDNDWWDSPYRKEQK